MIVRLFALLFAAMLLATPAHAQGGKRIALVIGNAGYNAQVGRLDNPGRDADLIAGALRGRGFAVTVVKDAGRVGLQQAVDRYARALGQAGPGAVGFFYYSGHGVANPENGRNYVVPVDAPSAGDDSLWYNSVELQQLVRTITTNAGDATNIVVFDACREVLALPKGKNLGAGYKGLERVAGVPSTLIAFSTSPGALAADRDKTATTGPYATELAKALGSSGADVRAMFDSVKFGVLQRTARKQVPWVEDGLLEQVFLGGAPTAAPAFVASKPAAVSGASDPARWGLTKQDVDTLGATDLLAKALLRNTFGTFREAAEGGDPIAAYLVGTAYAYGNGVAKNDPDAFYWTMKAAELGLAPAQVDVGFMIESGQGTAKDDAAAARWYRRASDAGHPIGLVNLGYFYDVGRGVPQSYAEALTLYRRAADLGNTRAMYNIGDLHHFGRGVAQDYGQAMVWYRKAAAGGYYRAMSDIGWYYLNGYGVKADYAQAMTWSRQAADAGSGAAPVNIGYLYEHGLGVAKNRAEAIKWYRVGAARGDKTAAENLKKLGEKP